MIRLALFGQPVRHSLSPRIHGLFAEQAQLDVEYRAIDTAPGSLAEALERFAGSGGVACNITVPLKREAQRLAVRCSDRVRMAEAANTLTLADDGWQAESTDGPGLMMDFDRLRIKPAGKRLALLGAGGAAASVLATLLAAGPESIDVFNRTAARADALALGHKGLGQVTGHNLAALATAEPFDLVINATSQGHAGMLPPVHDALLVTGGLVYDMNYGPAATPLANWCGERAIAHSAGLGMLVGQAAESFALWTGYRPDIGRVLNTLGQADNTP